MQEKREASLRIETAAQLFLIIKPEDGVLKVATPEMLTVDLINALVEEKFLSEAIRYLAIALHRREAIWWACVTHRNLSLKIDDTNEQKAWELVEEWVYNPTEENRQKTYSIAESLDFATPGSYGAMGVFWSGGSMAPPEAGLIVPPSPNLTGTAVGASILMTCAKGEPQKVTNRLKTALEIGLDVAYGGNGVSRDLK
jgi:hypothetical protein